MLPEDGFSNGQRYADPHRTVRPRAYSAGAYSLVGTAYSTTITTNHLIDKDAFWLSVSP